MSAELKTWPERIYLQSEDEHGTGTCEYLSSHEITWAEDQISAHDVKYVRADLVPAPAQGALTDAPTVGAVAWAVLADAGHVRYWSYERKKVADFAATIGAQVVPIVGVGQVSDAADACKRDGMGDWIGDLAAIQAQAGDTEGKAA
jgi:hypothetical protein